jgi:phosphotransferase system IIB component
MNILNNQGLTTNQLILIIILSALLVILIAATIYLVIKKNKQTTTNQTKTASITSTEITQLVIGLGGSDNVVSVTNEQSRIKVVLKDVAKIDQSVFKSLNIAAFVSGNELKMLIKQNASAVYQVLSNLNQ